LSGTIDKVQRQHVADTSKDAAEQRCASADKAMIVVVHKASSPHQEAPMSAAGRCPHLTAPERRSRWHISRPSPIAAATADGATRGNWPGAPERHHDNGGRRLARDRGHGLTMMGQVPDGEQKKSLSRPSPPIVFATRSSTTVLKTGAASASWPQPRSLDGTF